MYVKMSACLKWTFGLLGHNYRVATLSSSYLIALRIIIPNLK